MSTGRLGRRRTRCRGAVREAVKLGGQIEGELADPMCGRRGTKITIKSGLIICFQWQIRNKRPIGWGCGTFYRKTWVNRTEEYISMGLLLYQFLGTDLTLYLSGDSSWSPRCSCHGCARCAGRVAISTTFLMQQNLNIHGWTCFAVIEKWIRDQQVSCLVAMLVDSWRLGYGARMAVMSTRVQPNRWLVLITKKN